VSDPAVIDAIEADDVLSMGQLHKTIDHNRSLTVTNQTKGTSFTCHLNLSAREAQVLQHGGYLNTIKTVDLKEIA
jgi:hypothetical protein